MALSAPSTLEVSESLEGALIKVRVTIGPISLDVEDKADKLTLLVTKIVESFIGHKIIDITAATGAISEIETQTRRPAEK